MSVIFKVFLRFSNNDTDFRTSFSESWWLILRRIVMTGSSGFIGTHVALEVVNSNRLVKSECSIVCLSRDDVDLLKKDAAEKILNEYSPTDVVHLAWARTEGAHYDLSTEHLDWSRRTVELVHEFASHGIVNWVAGSAVENTEVNTSSSPYARSKKELHSELNNFDAVFCRWVSLPVVFSVLHKRPRLLLASLQGTPPGKPHDLNDFVEIRDVARQVLEILLDNRIGAQNVSSNFLISNIDFWLRIRESAEATPSCSCALHDHASLGSDGLTFTETFLMNGFQT